MKFLTRIIELSDSSLARKALVVQQQLCNRAEHARIPSWMVRLRQSMLSGPPYSVKLWRAFEASPDMRYDVKRIIIDESASVREEE